MHKRPLFTSYHVVLRFAYKIEFTMKSEAVEGLEKLNIHKWLTKS